METTLKRYVSALIAATLAACATPIADQRTALLSRAPCCKSWSDLEYKRLVLNQQITVQFGVASPVFAFPTGKSYTAAFQLDAGAGRGIRVASEFNGQLIGQFFRPILTFLDRDKNPIASASPNLRFVPSAMIPYTVAHMAGGVLVPDEAVYVVIYTRDFSDTAASATISTPPTVFMSGTTPIVVPNSPTSKSLEMSPTGELGMTLTTVSRQ
jgi:hypothetical protein